MNELIERAINKGSIIAVVGASNNKEKYGYKIYKDLKEAGYKVYPVSLREEEIQGDRAYQNLKSLPERPDVVDVVTPPQATEKVVDEAADQNVGIIWMQPGAESDVAIARAKKRGLEVIHNMCIIRERQGK